MTKSKDISINFFGLPLFGSQTSILLNEIRQHLVNSSKLAYIFTPNPEQIVEAVVDKNDKSIFFNDLTRATWLIPDGIGLVRASQFLHKIGKTSGSLKQRIAGADLVIELLTLQNELISQGTASLSSEVLIIGGKGYSDAQIARLGSQFPALSLTWEAGYDDVHAPTQAEETRLLNQLKKIRPAIVFVAFGAPLQERWLISHQHQLEAAGTRLAMAVGGSFDYLFGKVPRAPRWLRQLGLEWLFRLVRQPWRWRRQLRLLTFIQMVLQYERYERGPVDTADN